ncbi:MAG: glycosyltransferase family 4 protein [Fibrobacterota bacterium]|nr:glycosyltransferase family 4 protein [Fibrobacterota bacterium]
MIPRSVLVLTHELPPLGGGAGRAMSQLCLALREKGIRMEVWTQKPPAAARREFPFHVRYFATGRTVQFQTNILTILLYSARVLVSGLFLGRGKPDLILSNTAIPTGGVGAFLGWILGVPHVIWYHGADVHENRPQGAGLLYRLFLKAAWKNTSLHCFVSKGLLALAEGYGGMKSPRMVLPLFADHVIPGQASPQGKRVFLFTGRLEKVKNPFLFIRAIQSLHEEKCLPTDVGFRIVGGGALFAPLRERIREAGLASLVSLEAPVSGESMSAIYASAYALVLTSVVEGFPLTIMEAALCGVPSIGSDTLGINEEIEDGGTGLLFPRDDSGACAKAILRLLDEEGLRDRLGKNARDSARAHSAKKSAAILLESLERLG